jgi:transcriptional regulator with GAF, ATPase, and Fis domain
MTCKFCFALFPQNEKVSDTKHRLQQLMTQISSTNDKSLLLQTLVLFETLLNKIKQLQEENQKLKTNFETSELDRDNLVLELESMKNKLETANKVKSKI